MRLIAMLGLTLVHSGCNRIGPEVTAKVQAKPGVCVVVTMPEPWKTDEQPWLLLGRTALYALPANGEGFLFTLVGNDGPWDEMEKGLDQRYLVSLDPLGKIRAATDAEWQSRRPIPYTIADFDLSLTELDGPAPRGKIEHDPRRLKRNGEFGKSGAIWNHVTPSLVSPGNRFLMLKSFDGWYAAGKAAWSDNFYIDVYDIQTLRKLALIRGTWNDWTPEASLNPAQWISGNVLVFPFGTGMRKMIVCDFRSGRAVP